MLSRYLVPKPLRQALRISGDCTAVLSCAYTFLVFGFHVDYQFLILLSVLVLSLISLASVDMLISEDTRARLLSASPEARM